jgi:ethanolamine ammonia-lyase small subunit
MTATRLKQTIVSNIRPQGLALQAAAARIAWLLNQMRVQQRSGVALKDQMNQQVQVPAG